MPTYTDALTTPDGLRLHLRGWLPETDPRGVVLIVHGYAEHSGRYARLAETLTGVGFAVCSYDQRGFGESGGERGFIAGFEPLLGDLALVLADARERVPGVPLVLFGQSMGGLEVALYAESGRVPQPDGLVASAPAFALPDSPALQAVAGLLARLTPHLRTISLDASYLSRDPEVAKRALADPLFQTNRIHAATGAAMVAAGKQAREQAHRLKLPMLLYHGTGDRITSPEGTQTLYERAASSDKTLTLFEGVYHEPHNEPEPDRSRALDVLTDWLTARF